MGPDSGDVSPKKMEVEFSACITKGRSVRDNNDLTCKHRAAFLDFWMKIGVNREKKLQIEDAFNFHPHLRENRP